MQMLNERPTETGLLTRDQNQSIWQKLMEMVAAKQQQPQQVQNTGGELQIDPEAWKAFQRGFRGEK